MYLDQRQTLKKSLINDIKNLLPKGKQEGKNWVALNPRRDDKSLGSFKVNTDTGLWADFATDDVCGDIFDLVCYIENTTINDLFKKHNLVQECVSNTGHIKPSFYSKKHGKKADNVYPYYDTEGTNILQYACRFNLEKGKKEVMPYHFDHTLGYFVWKALPDPRPLYNLQNSYRKNVLVVEGEKTADAAQNLLGDDWFVTTWSGGCKAILKANWGLLERYEHVYIWPDNDLPGQSAANEIKKLIGDKAKIVTLPDGIPDKWDLADADSEEWTKERIIEQLNENIKKKALDSTPFRILGMSDGKNYFLSQNRIYAFSPSEIKKANLLYLADLAYWEDNYKGNKGVNWDSVANHLAQTSRSINFFSNEILRGRGAWSDKGNVIYHAGDRILEGTSSTKLDDFSSEYVYEISHPIKLNTSLSLSLEDRKMFTDMLSSFSWSNKTSATLLTGWLVCAPICGALDWRSSVWLTGESGSGKSWILKNIVSKVLNTFSLSVQGSTTEAGIRQALKRDALPIIFDEFENLNKQSAERIEQILEMARVASSENDARIIKGSAQGDCNGYKFRTMFLFSSINVSAKQTADTNRLCILELDKCPDNNFDAKKITEFITEDFCERFMTRILKNIKTIIKNISIFRMRAGMYFSDQRKGDQIGSLLGGAYSFTNDVIVTEENADKFIKSYDSSNPKIESDGNDSEKCLQYLMAYSIKIGLENIPIGTLINQVLGKNEFPNLLEGDPIFHLKANGILVEEGNIIIAHRHPKLDAIFASTQFDGGYGGILKRINGAIYVGKKRFGSGIRSSAWSLPFDA